MPGVLGKPKYHYNDIVSFKMKPYGETEEKTFTGTVEIIDKYGTFEQNEEPSYDIMVENYNEHGRCLVKHVRESLLFDPNVN